MATAEQEQLAALLAGLEPADAALRALLDDLARGYRLDALRTGLVDPDEVPAIQEESYVRSGDLYVLGEHRLLCGDATNAADVARLLDGAEPTLLATDPPYGVSLDPTWRDGVYNGLGPAEPGYLQVDPTEDAHGATRAPVRARRRTKGHRNTTVSGDTRVDWSDAFALVPSLTVGYVWHAGVHASEVAAGLERIGFEIVSQVIWDKGLFAIGRSWYHCAYAKADGQPCRMAPLHDRPFCFSHDPERAAEAAEARRIGGLRRKKEGTIAIAFDLPGLDTVAGIRRLLQIAATDAVGLDSGIPRLRVIISTAVAATNLLKVGELEDRLAHVEAAVARYDAAATDDLFDGP
jgi:hypothetical protein